MRIEAQVIGSVARLMLAEYRAGQRATSAGVRAVSTGLQRDWRGQVSSAGLGQRLARTIRTRAYPSRPSMNAAALVWTNAPKILDGFEQGATIASANGLFLAIPTDAAPRGRGGAKISPLEFERRTGKPLRLVYRRGRPSLLVAEGRVTARGRFAVSRSKTGRGLATVVMFVLVPRVTLRKRLDLARAAERWGDRLPGAIVGAWREVTP